MERRCEHCGAEYEVIPTQKGQQRYCSYTCRKNAEAMRRYHRMRTARSPAFAREAERRRLYARKWRQERKTRGQCPRCPNENDGEKIGVSICSTCYARMKGG